MLLVGYNMQTMEIPSLLHSPVLQVGMGWATTQHPTLHVKESLGEKRQHILHLALPFNGHATIHKVILPRLCSLLNFPQEAHSQL